jgi:hypothetical protein
VLGTGFIDLYFLNHQFEVWFYPACVGIGLVLIGAVVGLVCLIRCCCCRDKDSEAEDYPDLYAMPAPTIAPLPYRGPATATDIDSLPIIHLPSALPKSGVLSGTERAMLPPTIAAEAVNPLPPPSAVPPAFEHPPGGLPPPNFNLMQSAPSLYTYNSNEFQ